ncbi:MAG TPA: DUF2917 domain-containing protein [Burkholderiales bacterium]|nr:DUF2917 domain-containing protein [Burkholderiales bacterium]
MSTSVLELRRGEVIRLKGLPGSTIQAHRGRVWLTEEKSAHDVVLNAGQSHLLARPGLAVVEAFTDASISVVTRPMRAETAG